MIAIGSDHGGYTLKRALMDHLDKRGLAYKDFGTYSEESCDYPIYAKMVAHAVASGECERGILICGTGIGVSITANKIYLLDAPQGDSEVTETQRTSAEEYLRALGYEKLGGVFSRNGRTLHCFEPETEAVEELGFGLGAYSVIEGIRCRNTQSLTRYILYADQPDQLLTLC